MTEVAGRRPVGAVDATWLRMDRPGNLMVIESVVWFDSEGQFVWHCHIVEHEDNEMMRPYRIGPEQPGQPD